MPEPTFSILAKTFSGLEEVLAAELRQIEGASEIQPGRRMVSLVGDQRVLYHANLACRAAVRILKPIHTFDAAALAASMGESPDRALYLGVAQIDWSEHLGVRDSLAIDPVVHSSIFKNSLYTAQLAKDAIVDQFRARLDQRPSVNLDNPTCRINLHINHSQVTVYLDASGDSLHKRGYRHTAGEAPLNEVLAAGLIYLSGWDPTTPLADVMCGSGTIPIEAAMMRDRIYPGELRKQYGYRNWPDYDSALEASVRGQLTAERRTASDLVDRSLVPQIQASDIDPQILRAAAANATAAGVRDDIELAPANFPDARPRHEHGTLIINPPYDERLRVEQVAALYRRIGDALKQHWSGWTAWIFTGNLEAARHIGLRPSKRIPLFNGAIECRFLRFDLYTGSAEQKSPAPAAIQDATEHATPAAAHTASENVTAADPDEHAAIPTVARIAKPVAESLDASMDEVLDMESPIEGDEESNPAETNTAGSSTPASSNSPDAPAKDRGSSPGGGSRHATHKRTWQDQAADFRNRLTRMSKHWAKWARRQNLTCYRLYDRDVPEIPLSIDWYAGHLVVRAYGRPHDRSGVEQQMWQREMIETARVALDVPKSQVHAPDLDLAATDRSGRGAPVSRGERRQQFEVGEAGLRLVVDLDASATGLQLDERVLRSKVRDEASGKRFLQLWGRSGATTVFAAAGGAAQTVTVDAWEGNLRWTEENLQLNGISMREHALVHADPRDFLRQHVDDGNAPFDLIVLRPPAPRATDDFSQAADVHRDLNELVELVAASMVVGGKAYFVSSASRFRLSADNLPGVMVRDISRQTVPQDFRNKKIHRCWLILRSE